MSIYGGSNKNLFTITKQNANKVTGDNPSISSLLTNNKYNVQVNDQTKVAQIYKQGELVGGGVLGQTGDVSVGTVNLKTGKFTPDANRKLLADSNPSGNIVQAELKYFSSQEGIKQVKGASSITVQKGSLDNGATAAKAQANAKSITGTNVATTDANTLAQQQQGAAQSEDAKKDITNELSETKKRDAKTYDKLLVYPENLQLEYQDCIKFSMVKYVQPGLTPGASGEVNRSVIVQDGIPKLGTREILSTIVLPIPGGISDSNGVDWQADSLDGITEAFAKIAQESITKGAAGIQGSVGQVSKEAEKNVGALKATLASKFTELATGSSRIMQRQYGAAPNPNLELLFNGPQLRSFSFTFRLSPRSESEAVKVKKIIRYFKQGMTPKRSDGYLLLQSPNTFAISYITSNKEHPYLNKFKECALTQCNVNYTPEGNYMSYDGNERSMTSYELTLQFQELVPLFDDDYGSSDTNIGF